MTHDLHAIAIQFEDDLAPLIRRPKDMRKTDVSTLMKKIKFDEGVFPEISHVLLRGRRKSGYRCHLPENLPAPTKIDKESKVPLVPSRVIRVRSTCPFLF